MASEEFTSLKGLAQQLGMDRSHARRYVLKLGYVFHKRRTSDSHGQLTLCVAHTDANQIISRRTGEGFTSSTIVAESDVGHFYVIQLVPELDAKRIKLGFAENLDQRLRQHRTAAPTARLVRAWPCRRLWESTAIDSLTRMGCRLLLNEVFECDELEALLVRGDTFFNSLPLPDIRVPLAEGSPLHKGIVP